MLSGDGNILKTLKIIKMVYIKCKTQKVGRRELKKL